MFYLWYTPKLSGYDNLDEALEDSLHDPELALENREKKYFKRNLMILNLFPIVNVIGLWINTSSELIDFKTRLKL